MSYISSNGIATKSSRRGLKCVHCGHVIKPSRAQRASRFKRVCPECGWNHWEVCDRSLLHDEVAAAECVKKNIGSRMPEGGYSV